MRLNNNDLEKIGFKTAFKATLGFYVAQAVATLMGLVTIGLVILLVALGVKYL